MARLLALEQSCKKVTNWNIATTLFVRSKHVTWAEPFVSFVVFGSAVVALLVIVIAVVFMLNVVRKTDTLATKGKAHSIDTHVTKLVVSGLDEMARCACSIAVVLLVR